MFKIKPSKPVLFKFAFKRLYALKAIAVVTLISVLFTSLYLCYGGTSTAYAASDNTSTINFQARLMNASGSIVPDGCYNVQFQLFNVATGGTALWTESYTYASTNSGISGTCYSTNGTDMLNVVNGYLTVPLGSLTAFSTAPSINWNQPLYLTINIGGTSTTSVSYDGAMSPSLPLTGVPYAFTAGELAQYNGTYTSTLQLAAPTSGNQTFTIPDQGAAGSYDLLTTTAANADYIQNTSTLQSGTANFNISGTGIANTSLLTPDVDAVSSGGTLTIGGTNAATIYIGSTAETTSITLGRATVSNTITIGSAIAASNTQLINIGTSTTGTTDVTIGSTTSGSTAKLLGSTTSESLTTSGDTIQTAGNLTLDNSSGVPTLQYSTVYDILYVGNPGVDGIPGVIDLTDGTGDGNAVGLQTAPLTAFQSITLPNATGTVCLAVTGGGNCSTAGTGYIQDQSSIGTAQAGAYFDIAGSGVANTSLLTPDVDALTAGGTLDVGSTNSATGTLNIGYGATTGGITIGGSTQTGAINIGTGTGAQIINLGTGATGAKTVTVGSTSAGTTTVQAAGALTLMGGATSAWSVGGTNQNLTIQTSGTGTLKLDTVGAGTVAIGPSNATTINIGKNTAGATITIGSAGPGTSSSSTSVGIQCGTGACNFGSNQYDTGSISIGSQYNTGSVSIQSGGTLYLGNGGVANTIDLGNNSGAVLQTINVGANNTTAGSSANVKVGSTIAGTVTLQGEYTTEAITGSTNIIQTASGEGSTTAFEVEGSTTVLDVDTTHDRVGIGTAAPAYPLDVVGDINTSTTYSIAGATMLQAIGTGANTNILVGGAGSAAMTTAEAGNVGIGLGALNDDTTVGGAYGSYNFALGGNALFANTTGDGNVAIGTNALQDNVTGNASIGIGQGAGVNLAGTSNTNILLGYYAGGAASLTSGSSNVIIGGSDLSDSGATVTSATDNIILGTGDFATTAPTGALNGDIIIANNTGTNATPATDFLDVGNVLYGNTSTGTAYFQNSTNSATAFQIQDAGTAGAGTVIFNVNTSGNAITIGSGSTNITLYGTVVSGTISAIEPGTTETAETYHTCTFAAPSNGAWSGTLRYELLPDGLVDVNGDFTWTNSNTTGIDSPQEICSADLPAAYQPASEQLLSATIFSDGSNNFGPTTGHVPLVAITTGGVVETYEMTDLNKAASGQSVEIEVNGEYPLD